MKIIKTLTDLLKKPIEDYKRKKIDNLSNYAAMRAGYTAGWWKAHNDNNKYELFKNLSRDMAIKENVPLSAMKETAIQYLLKAIEYHNLAEEEGISKKEEERYWRLAEENLQEYYIKVEELKRENRTLINIILTPFKNPKRKNIKEYAEERAYYTYMWWKAHHYRNNESLIDYLTKDMSIKENVPPDAMKKIAIPYLIQAAEYHNLAEEEGIPKDEEENYWRLAEKSLGKYYAKIEELKEEYNKDKLIESISADTFVASMGSLGYLTINGYPLAVLAMFPIIKLYLNTADITGKWHFPKQQSPL